MDNILTREERFVHSFRSLCSEYGYRPYRMSKFEEYDLYAGNRSFLPAGGVITFTDTNGRLMALKPDVTLSIAKSMTPRPGEPVRVYYDESVYRAPDRQLGFQEITQAGLEYLGDVGLLRHGRGGHARGPQPGRHRQRLCAGHNAHGLCHRADRRARPGRPAPGGAAPRDRHAQRPTAYATSARRRGPPGRRRSVSAGSPRCTGLCVRR